MRIGGRITLQGFTAAVDGRARFALTPEARARIAAARAVVDAHAAAPEPVYGLNTGLGANLGHRVAPADMAAFQAQILRGRAAGVGPVLPERTCRAALLARAIGAARGAAGLSPPVVDLMLAMLDRGVAPALPTHGSIGAGDLVLGAHMGLALIGEGQAWADGRLGPAAEALGAAGLAPAMLAPGDALALASHSAVAAALAAEAAARARALLTLAQGAAALSVEGYAANPGIFDARVNALRPAAGQEAAAAWFRAALAGSAIEDGLPRAIQDALSFRTLAPVFGAASERVAALARAVEVELNGASESPAVLPGDPPAMRSTPNFHAADLALALDAAAIAVVPMATASAQRVVKLMAPGLSGLARFLSPEGGASAGMVALQKTAAALLAEVQRHAAPTPGAMAVSEMVEDVAPQTPLAARKLMDQLDAWRWMVGIEALVAAQAVDLRGPDALGAAGRALHGAIRAAVPPLGADRPTGGEVGAALAAVEEPAVMRALGALAPRRRPRGGPA